MLRGIPFCLSSVPADSRKRNPPSRESKPLLAVNLCDVDVVTFTDHLIFNEAVEITATDRVLGGPHAALWASFKACARR